MISLSARPPPPQGLVWLCMAIAKKCIDNHILLKGWNDLNCGRSRSSRRKYACLWSKGITASSLHWAANVGLDGKMSSFNSSSTHWADDRHRCYHPGETCFSCRNDAHWWSTLHLSKYMQGSHWKSLQFFFSLFGDNQWWHALSYASAAIQSHNQVIICHARASWQGNNSNVCEVSE